MFWMRKNIKLFLYILFENVNIIMVRGLMFLCVFFIGIIVMDLSLCCMIKIIGFYCCYSIL